MHSPQWLWLNKMWNKQRESYTIKSINVRGPIWIVKGQNLSENALILTHTHIRHATKFIELRPDICVLKNMRSENVYGTASFTFNLDEFGCRFDFSFCQCPIWLALNFYRLLFMYFGTFNRFAIASNQQRLDNRGFHIEIYGF